MYPSFLLERVDSSNIIAGEGEEVHPNAGGLIFMPNCIQYTNIALCEDWEKTFRYAMILELCTNRKTNEKQQLSQKVKCKNITICKYANVSETFPQCYSSITTKRNHLPKNPLPFILGLHGKPVQFHQSLSGCLACWRSGRKPSEWVWGGGQARWQAGGVVSGGGGARVWNAFVL